MRTFWGFDLGVTSVGFAVLRWDEWTSGEGAGEVVRLGVRVFPEAREEKDLSPKNAKRRQARVARRQVRRRRWRRVHLRRLLAGAALLPAHDARPGAGQDPYSLRARGLAEALPPHELGWALFHLLKRRGFTGSRKRPADARTDKKAEEKQAEKDDKEAEHRGKALAAKLQGRTLGEYLAAIEATIENPEQRRGQGQTRKMVQDELSSLWRAQAAHHPEILTKELRDKIEDVALFQRPTYFRRRTLGQCDLEAGEERALKAEWITQRFEMLQLVNALRLDGGNRPPLDPAQRERAISYLEADVKPTWAKLRAAIELPKGATFTHEHGKKESVRGNATEAALRTKLSAGWDHLPAATRNAIREEIGRAWHRVQYKTTKDGAVLEIRNAREIEKEREALATRAAAEWGLSAGQARTLAAIELPDGTAQHSLKGMQKLLPHLEAGEPYVTALQEEYTVQASSQLVRALPGPNPSELTKITDPFLRREMEKLLAGIRNPTVLRTLGELQKVVNTLLRVHGRPDVIRLELARDLKRSAEERRATDSEQRRREKAREDARKKLAELGKPAAGAEGEGNVVRLLLWQEQGGRCPYSGEAMSCAQALSAEATEIDHVFPVSRSFDDSQANKALCFARENRVKANRTPFEWLNPETDRWTHLSGTVWPQMESAGWPKAKRRRCEKPTLEQADDEAFTNRQLVDTAFIAKAARTHLGLLFGGGQAGFNAVEAVPGRATALLRRGWGIGLRKLLHGDATEKKKARDDLRHHAVDALVVALSGKSTVQRLSHYWQVREKTATRPSFPVPWPNFHEQTRRAVDAIVVSHRVQAKLSGPVHEETRLGDTGEHRDGYHLFVKRKPVSSLTARDVGAIRDPEIRRTLESAISAAGGDFRKGLAKEIRLPRKNGSPGPLIRRVRILVPRAPQAMLRTHPRKNIHAELAPGSLHHIAIYREGNVVRYLVSTKREVAARAARGQPPSLRAHPDGGRLCMVLHPGDALLRSAADGLGSLVVIRKFLSNGQIFYKPLTMADDPKPEESKRPGPLVAAGWHKVSIDPIGRIRKAR